MISCLFFADLFDQFILKIHPISQLVIYKKGKSYYNIISWPIFRDILHVQFLQQIIQLACYNFQESFNWFEKPLPDKLMKGCMPAKSSTHRFSLLTKDTFTIAYEKNENDTGKLIDWKHDSIELYFLRDFNDTMIMYVNYRKIFKLYINNDNYPFSEATKGSEFSGLTYNIGIKIKKPAIDIELTSQKKFIEFVVDKNFSSCNIDRYNGNRAITHRKHYYEIYINIIKKYLLQWRKLPQLPTPQLCAI